MRFFTGFVFAVIGALTVCAPATAHDACWERIERVYLPVTDSPPTYYCVILVPCSTSSAFAAATGFDSKGFGHAWDTEVFCEAQVQTAAATGIFSETWRDSCAVGEVRLSGHTIVAGRAGLIEADCAGAALGYQQITSNIFSTPIDAKLAHSAGETVVGQLGSLKAGHDGLQLTYTITNGLGEGSYADFDQESRFEEKHENTFTINFKSRAYIKVWANSGFLQGQALVRARMGGVSSAVAVLGTRPHNH
jgi:hypothetical protein